MPKIQGLRPLDRFLVIAHLLAVPMASHAQVAPRDTVRQKEPPAIEDNSFLIEEAYNQDAGIVQEISTFQRTRQGLWAYSLTQEFPVGGQRNQLSYTLPVLHLAPRQQGIGDIALNYRLQILGKDEEALWFAPRFSVYLPTGDVKSGRGAGGYGYEINLPVSYAFSDKLVTHLNAGGSIVDGESIGGVRRITRNSRAGASVIWKPQANFNVMLEGTAARNEALDGAGVRQWFNSAVISPGVRGAFNFASGLQIVPGLAFPIGVGPSDGQRDVFFYLSFEHPVR